MCKKWENGAKWPILSKSPRATSAGLRSGLLSEFAHTPARWPKVRLRHGPIARWLDGVARSVWRGTVSNCLCSWVQFSGPTSRPAFGRVNAYASVEYLLLPETSISAEFGFTLFCSHEGVRDYRCLTYRFLAPLYVRATCTMERSRDCWHFVRIITLFADNFSGKPASVTRRSRWWICVASPSHWSGRMSYWPTDCE